MSDVTRILSAMEQGDPQASEQLLPLVYQELRRLAGEKMAQEKPGQTLQPTALVHLLARGLRRGYPRPHERRNAHPERHGTGRSTSLGAAFAAGLSGTAPLGRRKDGPRKAGPNSSTHCSGAPACEGPTARVSSAT